MHIYFTASSTAQRKYLREYEKILKLLHARKNQVTGGYLLNQPENKSITPEEIFSREKKRIEEADFVVAEVSEPSLGVGSQIAYALTIDKPVLAMFYKAGPNRLSPMIEGNPSDSLYLEHYDNDNLNLIIKNFFKHIEETKKHKGKLIVLEGGDGSGKTTQTKMLVSYLKKQHRKVKQIEFPRYYTSFHGDIVARFQRGEFGTIDSVSPYLISLAYALDRLSMRDQINDWLKKGYILIANRYVPSSMAHQAAKLPIDKRKKFLDWLDELEYRVHKMPRETMVIYLHVPWQIGQKLSAKKRDKKYLKGGRDISEENNIHMEESEKMYFWLLSHRKNWVKIDCVKNSKMKNKEEIQEEIINFI